MANYERGVYEPSDEVRVFDGSDDDEDVEGSRLPLLIVLALLVLAMFAGVVWLAYSQGVARGRTETPVIAAASCAARIAPQNPGGAQQPYQGFKIYEQPAPPDDDTAASRPLGLLCDLGKPKTGSGWDKHHAATLAAWKKSGGISCSSRHVIAIGRSPL